MITFSVKLQKPPDVIMSFIIIITDIQSYEYIRNACQSPNYIYKLSWEINQNHESFSHNY